MTFTLFSTNSPPNALNKTLTQEQSTMGELLNPSSILNPVLVLANTAATRSANYLYIPDFGRYYFITDSTIISGGRVQISARVDVLYTYRNSINNLSITAERSETHYNRYLQDGAIPTENRLQTQIKRLVGGATFAPSVGSWVLTTY